MNSLVKKESNCIIPPLDDISTQNQPPKKNNKIIFINFGRRKEKNYFFVHKTQINLFEIFF